MIKKDRPIHAHPIRSLRANLPRLTGDQPHGWAEHLLLQDRAIKRSTFLNCLLVLILSDAFRYASMHKKNLSEEIMAIQKTTVKALPEVAISGS